MREWRISLTDGRELGGAEYGDAEGRPVMLFHGQPGNRLFHPSVEQTRKAGVRLIVPDRPGYGISSFEEGRRLLDWPRDVAAIADHLGIQQIDIIGYSGGGPYALACAYAIPERLGRVCVVAGAPPMKVAGLRKKLMMVTKVNYIFARYAGVAFNWFFNVYWRQARRKPAGFIELITRQAPPPDQEVLADRDFRAMLLGVWQENLRVDSRGYVHDAKVLMDRWGFDLEEITLMVELWWGAHDKNVPKLVMDYFAGKLPKCKTHILLEAGHFGVLSCWMQILRG
jgi:pimeloyl-ACP methyl ester carboxylesterase